MRRRIDSSQEFQTKALNTFQRGLPNVPANKFYGATQHYLLFHRRHVQVVAIRNEPFLQDKIKPALSVMHAKGNALEC